LLEILFKWLFALSLVTFAATLILKDRLPEPALYDTGLLQAPKQRPTSKKKFSTQVNGQTYVIEPKYSYELHGVVVSYHDADSFIDLTHHDKWKDFLNLRDLCVVWGDNVTSGVYQDMGFTNDSWTCWYSWPTREVGRRFDKTQLSNNHLLVDDPDVQAALMAAEPGDHVRFKGYLAAYANPANGFFRGTSTTRTDTGNGACETVYVEDFELISKANSGVRSLYQVAKWTAVISLIGYVVMLFLTPVRRGVR